MSSGTKAVPYLRLPVPIGLILGSFFVITLPLSAYQLLPHPDVPGLGTLVLYLTAFQTMILGVSHFAITGALYLQHDNLEHFTSTRGRIAVYFVAPLCIFASYGLIYGTRFAVTYPLFTLVLFTSLRIFDFGHVGRQSFGMLQLVKGSYGVKMPRWTRNAEDILFMALASLQMGTFVIGGTFDSEVALLRWGAIATGVLFLSICGGYAWYFAKQGKAADLWIPVAYLLLQTLAAALAVYMTALYAVGLAMHYVEYHVVMAPRCFNTELDDRWRVDRFMTWLRNNRVVFYGVLVLVAFTVMTLVPMALEVVGSSTAEFPLRFFLHAVGGLSLAHYFVEAFLWKFSEPHYGKKLGPLYFGPREK